MDSKGVDFSSRKDLSVLHALAIRCCSWGYYWKDQLPKNSAEWKECEEVILSMIRYACDHGVLEHPDVKESDYFGDTVLGKICHGYKPPEECVEVDSIARAVFFELVKYPLYDAKMTLLAFACQTKWASLVKQLVDMGHAIDKEDTFFTETPLSIVRSEGNLKLALALTSKKKRVYP